MLAVNPSIRNPLECGDLHLPKGTIIEADGELVPLLVERTIPVDRVVSTPDGFVEGRRNHPVGMVHFPRVFWRDRSGAWCSVQVTPAVAAANGAVLPELPHGSAYDGLTDAWI